MAPSEPGSVKSVELRVGTVIPAATLLTLIVGAIWWAATIDNRLEVFEGSLGDIADGVERIASRQWSADQQTIWIGAANLELRNWQRELEVALDDLGVALDDAQLPSVKLPSISDVFQD